MVIHAGEVKLYKVHWWTNPMQTIAGWISKRAESGIARPSPVLDRLQHNFELSIRTFKA